MFFCSNAIKGIPHDAVDNVNILFVSASEMRKDFLVAFSQEAALTVSSVASLDAVCRELDAGQEQWDGIIIDLVAYVKFTPAEKDYFNSLMQTHPVGLMCKAANGRISCFHPMRCETWDISGFRLYCQKSHTPRPVRQQRRCDLHVNLTLSHVSQSSILADRVRVHHEKAITCNVSKGGLYIVTCGDYTIGDIVNLSIPVLGGGKPIRCEVRWVKSWDANNCGLPGIGVQFTSIQPSQLAALRGLMNTRALIQ